MGGGSAPGAEDVGGASVGPSSTQMRSYVL